MKSLVLILLAAAVAEGATRRMLPFRESWLPLGRPLDDALTDPARNVEGRSVEVDKDAENGLQKRITGGAETTPHAYPFMTLLAADYGYGWTFRCGCFILNEDTVITAAHCVDGVSASNLQVRAGEHDIYVTEGTEQFRGVASTIMHPDYSDVGSDGYPNDIAVIKLSSPLVFDQYVDSYPIAAAGETFTGTATLIGWGRMDRRQYPDELREVVSTILTTEECRSYWSASAIKETHICFKGDSTNRRAGSCYGDSGGPCIADGKVIGVTSWGSSGCRNRRYPSVYTRISEFESWIMTHVN